MYIYILNQFNIFVRDFFFLYFYRYCDYGYFWILILGFYLGVIIGCVLYILFVGFYWLLEYEISGDIQLDNKGKEKNKEFIGIGLMLQSEEVIEKKSV